MSNDIPDIVVGRLPIYLRALTQMAQNGQDVTSSRELGHYLGISSAQIRKDLSHFGGFGKQGTGYHIETLRKKLQQILHVDREWPTIIVGAGYLGHALAHYRGFVPRGFRIVAIFDNHNERIGEEFEGMIVQPMDNLQPEIAAHKAQIAMLAVPAENAQTVTNQLIEYGIHGILNYAPINLIVPDGVYVQYIDPLVELQHMTYYLSK